MKSKLFASLLVSASLWACAAIDQHVRVSDWPELTVVEHYVPHHEMRDRCVSYVAFGESPEACAEFNFTARRCDIWYSADFPPQSWIVKHERMHCAGYDHVGSNDMKRLWDDWRSRARQSAARAL